MKRVLLTLCGAATLMVASVAPVRADLVVISSEFQTSTSQAEINTNPGAFVSSNGPTVTDNSMALLTSSAVSVGPDPITGGYAQANTSGSAAAPALNTNGQLELSVSGVAQAMAQYGQRQGEPGLITTTALSDAQTTGGYAFELTQATTGNVVAFINAPNIFTYVTLTGPNGFSVAPPSGVFFNLVGIPFPQGSYQILYNAHARAVADAPGPLVQVQAGYSFRIELTTIPEASSVLLVGVVGVVGLGGASCLRRQGPVSTG